MKLHHVLLFLVLSGTSLQAQDYEPFLVPVFSPVPTPGGYGSQWATDFYIHNTGDTFAIAENYGGGCSLEPCPPGDIPPKTTVRVRFMRGFFVDDAIPGVVLKVRRADADLLHFQLRVRDIARSAFGWGTWMPVVRESTAPGGTVHLLSVPLEPGYRQLLRVYSFGNLGRIRVRIFGTAADADGGAAVPDPLLSEFSLDLIQNAVSDPGYAQFMAFDELPGGFSLIRLELIPEGDFKSWGMVSITNNATQEVTGIYPN